MGSINEIIGVVDIPNFTFEQQLVKNRILLDYILRDKDYSVIILDLIKKFNINSEEELGDHISYLNKKYGITFKEDKIKRYLELELNKLKK